QLTAQSLSGQSFHDHVPRRRRFRGPNRNIESHFASPDAVSLPGRWRICRFFRPRGRSDSTTGVGVPILLMTAYRAHHGRRAVRGGAPGGGPSMKRSRVTSVAAVLVGTGLALGQTTRPGAVFVTEEPTPSPSVIRVDPKDSPPPPARLQPVKPAPKPPI